MNLVDSHCHLYYEPFISNLDNTILDCKNNNINYLLSIGVDFETSKKNILISEKYKEVYCTIGLHPNNIKEKNKELDKILDLYEKDKKIIGIGEAGIDLYRSKDNLKDQIYYFKKQINFALQKDLPIIIHTRDADHETYKVLNEFKSSKLKFVVHSFTGSEDFAYKCLNIGGYISFNGILTFKKSQNLREICKKIPLDKILIETDSPYLSPEPCRGRINKPANVRIVAEYLSKIKELSIEEISNITFNNFKKIFSLNEYS